MASTTNYSWSTPDDTALVKDGAAAIRSLGSAIDSTVFTNAGAAIAKTIVDAKGDIIAATAADTVSRLAVGSNDQVLTADSSTATGLKWAAVASGGWTTIASGNFPTGATTLTISSIPTTYKFLRIIVRDVNYGVSNNGEMKARINANTSLHQTIATFPNVSNAATTDGFKVCDFYLGNGDMYAIFDFYNYADTTTYKHFNMQSMSQTASSSYDTRLIFGSFRSTSAITSIEFYEPGGTLNFAAGNYIVYGGN